MSDIPKAREILCTLLRYEELPTFAVKAIGDALVLLDREKPAGGFMVKRDDVRMTEEEVAEAIRLRYVEKWGLKRIQMHLGHNSGRVSEAINRKRNGI